MKATFQSNQFTFSELPSEMFSFLEKWTLVVNAADSFIPNQSSTKPVVRGPKTSGRGQVEGEKTIGRARPSTFHLQPPALKLSEP